MERVSKHRVRSDPERTSMERILAMAVAMALAGWTLAGCCQESCKPAAADEAAPVVAAPVEAAPEAEEAADGVLEIEPVEVAPDAAEEASESPAATGAELPEVVAKVDGAEITRAEVEKMMGIIREQMSANFPAGQLEAVMPRLQEQVIRELIDRQILLNAAADTTFTDEEFATELEEMKAQLPPGVTVEELLQKTKMGMDELKEQMKIRKMLLGKANEAPAASEEECLAFFDENKDGMAEEASVAASHILVSVSRDADEAERAAARAKIDDLKAQLDAGADFAELAKENSDCPSKANGGSLGRFGKGMMVPEFEDAAFSQEIGKVGDVVETTFGYHLVLVTDRSEGKEAEYADVKERISELLTAQRQQEAVRTFVEGLEAAAQVERFDEGLKEEEAPALPFGLEIVDEEVEAAASGDGEEPAAEEDVAENAIDEAASAVPAAVEAAADEASEAVSEAIDAAGDAVDAAVEEAAPAAEEAAGALDGAVESMKGLAESAAESVKDAAASAGETLGTVKESAGKALEGAKDAAAEAAENAKDALGAAAEALQGAAKDAAAAAGDALEAAKGAVTKSAAAADEAAE